MVPLWIGAHHSLLGAGRSANPTIRHGVLAMSTGGFFGGMGGMGGGGNYGAYPGCGCSSVFIILAGLLLVFGGCLRMVGQ
jgi:hypothetical protein